MRKVLEASDAEVIDAGEVRDRIGLGSNPGGGTASSTDN